VPVEGQRPRDDQRRGDGQGDRQRRNVGTQAPSVEQWQQDGGSTISAGASEPLHRNAMPAGGTSSTPRGP